MSSFSTESKQPSSTCLSESEGERQRGQCKQLREGEKDLFYRFPHNLGRCDRDNTAIVTERQRESRGGTAAAATAAAAVCRLEIGPLTGLPDFEINFYLKDVRRTHMW